MCRLIPPSLSSCYFQLEVVAEAKSRRSLGPRTCGKGASSQSLTLSNEVRVECWGRLPAALAGLFSVYPQHFGLRIARTLPLHGPQKSTTGQGTDWVWTRVGDGEGEMDESRQALSRTAQSFHPSDPPGRLRNSSCWNLTSQTADLVQNLYLGQTRGSQLSHELAWTPLDSQ